MRRGIQFSDVTFQYPGKPDSLSHLNLTIPKGAFMGITGINGSGKSTMTYLINGLIPHSVPGNLTGDVTVDGNSVRAKSVSFLSRIVGMVFQNPDYSLFNLTVAEEVAFGLKNLTGNADARHISSALRMVGLSGFEPRDPQSLSYGEKQKVCLASVLALNVGYLVLDEPTSMLDYKSSLELYTLLRSLNEQGKTIITVEHDTDFLWDYTKECIVIDHGAIISSGPTQTILSDHRKLMKLGIKVPRGVSV